MVSLSPTALEAFFTEEDDSAVVMLNLIRFKPNGGRERYAEYLEMAQPSLARYGAKILFCGDGLAALTDGQEQEWDTVTLVRYPGRSAFGKMIGDPEYQIAFKVGESAISEIVLQPFKQIASHT